MIKAKPTPTTPVEWEDNFIAPSRLTALTLQKCDSYLEAAHFAHLLTILPNSRTILEAGCGYGQNAYAFASLGYRSIGLDFSHKVLAVARERPVSPELQAKIDWVQGTILNLPLGSNVLDCHASFGVLEHFTRPQQKAILSEAYRVLKPGAILYLYVPHFWSAWTIRRNIIYWLRKGLPGHLVWQRNISKSVLRKICSEAGFKTELIQSLYASDGLKAGLSLPSSILRLVPSSLAEVSARLTAKLGQWCDRRNILGMGLVYIGGKKLET